MKISGPIAPADVMDAINADIPVFVFEVFNGLIKRKLHNGRAVIYQDDVIDSLMQYVPEGKNMGHIFDEAWLGVESAYRKVGWKVSYDKPTTWGGEEYFRTHYTFEK